MPHPLMPALVFAAFLVGCDEMTREQVIAATKQCKDAGMTPQIIGNVWTYGIYKVNCVPKETP